MLLFLALNPFWKFPGEQTRRASQAPFVSPLQRWKVEAKDKQPFLCPELLTFFFSFFFSPLPCFSFQFGVCMCGLSCSAIGVGPCHKWNPFMINEVTIAMTFPSLLQWDGGGGSFREKKKKRNYHSQLSPPRSLSDNQPNSQNGSYGLFRSQHLSDRRGKGAGIRRKAFSARECFSVCLWVKSVGLQLSYVLWESQFPTIVSSAVARHWQGL